jgi:hypothetical protein
MAPEILKRVGVPSSWTSYKQWHHVTLYRDESIPMQSVHEKPKQSLQFGTLDGLLDGLHLHLSYIKV